MVDGPHDHYLHRLRQPDPNPAPSSGFLALELQEAEQLLQRLQDNSTGKRTSRGAALVARRSFFWICSALSAIGIFAAAVLISTKSFHGDPMASAQMAPQSGTHGVAWPPGATKLGAGFLVTLSMDGRTYVLLLLRNSKHNGNTWGLPGGNVEPEDASLHDTALREAREEVGHLPAGLKEMGHVLTRRGEGNTKFFTVYIAGADPGQLEEYKPELNPGESKDWRWVDTEALLGRQLPMHPVTEILFHEAGVKEQVMALLAPATVPTPRALVEAEEEAVAAPLPDLQNGSGGHLGGGGNMGPEGTQRQELPAEEGLQLSDPLTTADFKSPPLPSRTDKLGAGLLILAMEDGRPYVLLLFRNSKNNGDTWGLPGGDLDKGETLAEAALRKAKKDMGALPPARVLGHITTRRGKKRDKYYTVFVAYTSFFVMETYRPQLDLEERSASKWVALSDIVARKVELHPVVDAIISSTGNLNKLQLLLSAATSPEAPAALSQLQPLTADFPSPEIPQAVEKIGAGMLFMTSQGGELHALLLYRNSKHNGETWGLPGGNLDKGETLAEVAVREATEEMGDAPPARVLGHIITRRGKHKQKFYAVFVACVSSSAKEAYEPDLDLDEHSAWQWVPVQEMLAHQLPLHPVVDMVMHDSSNFAQLQKLMASSTCS
eukprot:CAMPEP_0117654666 /NCGR_PEP_ID=MMETSP0804-20121206/3867_1 /TAXON_ID=1074897 /ORGANISM="Tetraselmis astigmatica, Strain CCMP880" /LENGTH=661 /DNA_ID=CAMNT_0005460965 /DNA_START=154 /DNA_END=2139 /DNA_ORIENTATION=+